jgi:hypothetical protein
MTSYYVSIGYNRGSFTKYGNNYEWNMLKQTARNICDNPNKIIEEARRLDSPETCTKGCCNLETYADNYKAEIGSQGHPLFFSEIEDDKYLVQNASADDDIKFHVRRAFIRLLIEEMHRERIEINIKVI